MNREDITRMAREADRYADKNGPSAWLHPDEFAAFRDERFAALVAAAEREACAKVCDFAINSPYVSQIAAAIRARGQA